MKVQVSHFASPATQAVIQANRIAQLPLQPKIAFNFLKLLKRIGEEVNSFEAARMAAFRKYGREVEANGQQMFEVPKANMEEFQNAMKEFIEVEIEFSFEPIKLSDFGDEKLSAQEIAALEPFLIVE